MLLASLGQAGKYWRGFDGPIGSRIRHAGAIAVSEAVNQ
jgi:hypothetical protein